MIWTERDKYTSIRLYAHSNLVPVPESLTFIYTETLYYTAIINTLSRKGKCAFET